MQILNSDWLIKMLAKSGSTPETRMLSLFDILGDWLDAPQIRDSITQEPSASPSLLLQYLTNQAKAAHAAMPEMLAEQIIFLVTSALKDHQEAKSASLQHAKQVAIALISAQREKQESTFKLNKPSLYAATAVLLSGIAIGALLFHHQSIKETTIARSQIAPSMLNQIEVAKVSAENPKKTAELYASIETMRGGDCQFIEALQIPDVDKKIYLENVVGGQAPTNAHDQMIAQRYMQKIRCNYTPMLMKNSTN